jgi:pyochelin biosynthetic protein PchC
METSTSAWIRRFHPAPDAPTRLVCFPYAGGSASYFFPVSRSLAPGIDVFAIQYPGRQDRRAEARIDDVRELADIVVEELEPWLDKPITLFGHSLGATLAFEVALRLERDGVEPLGLFASGRRAPSRHRENERVHLSTDDGLIAKLKQMSGTDASLLEDDEVVRMILPAFRSDYKAAETYRYQPGPKLLCPILTLTGDTDPEVTLDEARAWADHTEGEFSLQVFRGGHFYLNEHAPAVLAEISKHIADQ